MNRAVTEVDRLGESLLICNSVADDILTGLYNIKYLLQPDQHIFIDSVINDGTNRTQTPKSSWPRIFSDQSMQTLLRIFLKRYPEHPHAEISKLPVYYAFATDAKGISDELQPYYNIICDALEFTESTKAVLLLCDKLHSSAANCQTHFLLVDQILTLLSNFLFVQILIFELGISKRAVISIYSYLQPAETTSNNVKISSKYHRLVNYLEGNETFMQKIQEDLSPISGFIALALSSLLGEYNRYGNLSAEMLRKDMHLNFLAGTTIGASQSLEHALKLNMLPLVNRMPIFTVVAFICCPNELIKRQECINAFKTALAQSVNFVMIRSEMLNVMELCDSVSKSNVKCAKIFRQIVADGLGSSLTEAYQFHRDRRDYLRFVLRQFVLILADQPDILCQKIREVVAIVRIAREEVAWYFAHHEKMTATRNQLSVTDHRITELVELIVDLREIIENNWEYLLKDSIQLIQNVLSPNFRMKVSNTFQNCHGITESATQCLSSILESNDFHFETLRLNYIRLLVQFGLPKFKNINADAFIKLMNTILQRFQFADCLAQIMDELSLKFLFYYRPILQGVFEDIMRQQPNQMRSVAVYASIAKEFLRNARLYFPKELDRIGERSCLFVEDCLKEISQSASQYLYNIAVYKSQLSRQLVAPNAVIFVPNRRDKKKKDESAQVMKPGNESELLNLSALGPLPILVLALENSLCSIVKNSKIEIYNQVFSADEFFLESLSSKFKSFLIQSSTFQDIRSSIISPKETIDDLSHYPKRPTNYLNDLEAYIGVVACFDRALGVNMIENVGQSLTEQLNIHNARQQIEDLSGLKGKTLSRTRRAQLPDQISSRGSANMGIYAWFYAEYCRERFSSNPPSLLFSDLHKSAFYQIAGGIKSIVTYFNPMELVALCRLIGPLGVTFIQERLLVILEQLTRDASDIVAMNLEALQTLHKVMELRTEKLKHIPEFIQKIREIGFILSLRRKLIEALKMVVSVKLTSVLSNSLSERSFPGFLFQVADEHAISRNDAPFNVVLKSTLPEAIKYQFPVAFAVALRYLINDEKNIYSPFIDVFENGSDALTVGINSIMSFVGSTISPLENISLMRDFLSLVTILLMRTKEPTKDQNRVSFILLSKFKICDSLEEFVPYSLIRSIYEDSFNKRRINQNQAKAEILEV